MSSIDDITIDSFGGNCPVQGEGTVDGKPFYFRARGRRWTLSIGGEDLIAAPEWHYEESYGDDEFAAGWMERDEALEFLAQGDRQVPARGGEHGRVHYDAEGSGMTNLNLYVLKVAPSMLKPSTADEHGFSEWSDVHGFVALAESEEQARRLAAAAESSGPWWLNPEITTCEQVDAAAGDARVLLADTPTG